MRVMLSEAELPGASAARAVARRLGIPVDDCVKAHGRYSIIFSIGSTRMELAPSAFSFSMVSQNRVSLLTMCIATLLVARQRQNGWTLSARQQGNHFVQALGRRMHHDVFGFTRLNHALNAGQQLVDELLFMRRPSRRRA